MSSKPHAKSLRAPNGAELITRFAKQGGTIRAADGLESMGTRIQDQFGSGQVAAPTTPTPQVMNKEAARGMSTGGFNMVMPAGLQMRDGGELRAANGFLGNLRKVIMPTEAEKAAKAQYLAGSTPAPAPQPVPTQGISGYVGNGALEGRMKAAGLRDGGDLRTGHGGAVPGTGSGDKIPAKYEPGEFVVSNDMLDAQPELRQHLRGLREEVLAEKGMTPEQADAKAVSGTGLRAAGGAELIPGQGSKAPAYDMSQQDYMNNDVGRNIQNSVNALSGAGTGIMAGPSAYLNLGRKATYEQNNGSLAGGKPGGSGGPGAGGSPGAGDALAGVQGGILPVTRTILRERGRETADLAARGNWSGAIGRGIRGGLEGVGALALDTVGPALGMMEPLGRGIANTAAAAVTGDDAPMFSKPTIPTAQNRPAAVPASPAPDTYPQVNATSNARTLRQGDPSSSDLNDIHSNAMIENRNPDGKVTKVGNSYSGGNVSGEVSFQGADGNALRGRPGGGYMSSSAEDGAARLSEARANLRNPDGSSWSASDNAIMAANLRDGVDKYRGTSRDTRGAGADKYANMPIKTAAAMRVADAQAASQMATTQANNAVTREGNQMHLDAAMAPMRYAAQQRKLAGELLTQTGGDLGAATKLAMRYGVDPTHLQSAWSTDTTNRTAEQNMGDKARDGMAKEFLAYDPATGKANDDLSARRFAAVQKIMPGADLMSTEGRSKNLPEMQTLAKIFDRVSGSPQMGLDKINPLVPKGAARDAMPDLKGAKLVRQGLAGAITPGSSPNGYYLQTANGDVPLGADLSERELEIIRHATETGNWRGAPKKTQ